MYIGLPGVPAFEAGGAKLDAEEAFWFCSFLIAKKAFASLVL